MKFHKCESTTKENCVFQNLWENHKDKDIQKIVFACDRACHAKFIPPRGGAILVVENAIFILWPLKWRNQVAKINMCFIQTTLNFLLYHMKKKFRIYLISQECSVLGAMRGAKTKTTI